MAEMRAIWDLLQICDASNVTLAVVESDSMNVVRMLKGEMTTQWKCSKWSKMIQKHPSFCSVVFSHCYRESNAVADFLAK